MDAARVQVSARPVRRSKRLRLRFSSRSLLLFLFLSVFYFEQQDVFLCFSDFEGSSPRARIAPRAHPPRARPQDALLALNSNQGQRRAEGAGEPQAHGHANQTRAPESVRLPPLAERREKESWRNFRGASP